MRVRRLVLVVIGGMVMMGAGILRLWGGAFSGFPLEGLRGGWSARSSDERLLWRGEERGVPALRLSPSDGDLGTVSCGSARETSFVLTNVGTAPVKIFEVRTEGVFSVVRAPLLPARIGPGVSVRVNVAFAPEKPGRVADRLRIVSDAPSGVLSVPLRAIAVGAGTLVAGTGQKLGRHRGDGRLAKRPMRALAHREKVTVMARAADESARRSEVRLPLPVSAPVALPVVHPISELTSFLEGMGPVALHPASDEASHELGKGAGMNRSGESRP
ncbi:hypothetical protein HRbin08_01127 [bacterium HR08]|nr:hypothetical protein HRbin08_01127 [bacterium HR08]